MPGVLQSIRSQRVGHDWVSEQQQQLEVKDPKQRPEKSDSVSFTAGVSLIRKHLNILSVGLQRAKSFSTH